MIDIKLLQKDFENISNNLKKKNVDIQLLANIKSLILNTKQKRQELENIISKQKKLSNEFGRYKKENLDIKALQEDINNIKEQKQNLENEVKIKEEEINNIILTIPNLCDETVPDGLDESENKIIEYIGEKPSFNFNVKEHWDIKDNNIDFIRGVKLSKSRFSALKNKTAKLNRALINYMLDFNTKRGFKEWRLPLMANSNTLIGT